MPDRIVRVREQFAVVDVEVARFSAASGLGCPPGCGACCTSPEVEASIVELAPMAAALCDKGRALDVLEQLSASPMPAPCVLYRADPSTVGQGRCSAYAERPMICRLFGFGARRTRTGRTELVACRTMRASDPERMAAVAGNEVLVDLAPMMSDHAQAVAAESHSTGARLMPINAALRQALERELFLRRLAGEAEVGLTVPPTDGEGEGDGATEPPLAAA